MIGDSRYKIEEEIARGGMGIVLRVRDGDLDRTLAMKRMASAPDESMEGSEAGRFARFMEEAQVTAQLDHPAIVPVHDLGFDEDGTGWYTMKLVEGRELGQVFDLARAKKEGWTGAGVLRVLVQVCQALSYAHGKGVIHRDLKPANIMVGEFGEVYVMDWGLAKVEGSEVTSPREDDEISGGGMSTLDGSVMGTPEFMASEQARGEEADERSDVYAVGALIYDFLAGRPPYQGEAREVVKKVASEAPDPLPKSARGELSTICGKAMERKREDRYESVGELGQEIQRYLDGQVVEAYESGAWAELKKLVLRNKGVSAALAAVFLSMVGMLVMQVMAKREVEESQGKAIAALERMSVGQGLSTGKDLDYGKAAYWFHRAEDLAMDESRRQTHRVRAQIAEERQTEPVRALMVPYLTGGNCRIDFSPDGRFLLVTHSEDQEVKQVVDVDEEVLLKSLTGEVVFEDVAFCQVTGRVALVSRGRGRVCEVFSPGKREDAVMVELVGEGTQIGALAFSPDGEFLFVGAENGRVFNFSERAFEQRIYRHSNGQRIGFATFDPKGELVMTATHKDRQDRDRSGLRVFEVGGDGGALFGRKENWFWPNILRPSFLKGGTEIVHVTKPGRMERVVARTGVVLAQKAAVATDVNADAEKFVDGGGDFVMEQNERLIDTMMGVPRFRPLHERVLANRPWLREISLRDGTIVRPVGLNRHEVQYVAVSHDGMMAAGWESDGLMRFWSLKESEWQFEAGSSEGCVFSPSGRWITEVGGKTVQVYEATTGKKIGPELGLSGEAVEVVFSPDGRELAIGLAGGRVEFWDWREGKRVGLGDGLPGEVLCSHYSRDGKWLAVMCRSGELVSVERETGKVVVLVRHEKIRERVSAPWSLKGITFSKNGRWLMVWSSCEGVTVWDCEKGERAKSPPVKEGRYVELMKVKEEKLVFLEMDNWEQVFDVMEWDLNEGKWTRDPIDAGRGIYSNLDVSEDGWQILLSRNGEEYASLAERDQDGEWTWRKVISLGRAASFFVPGTPFAVGVTSTGPSRFAMVDLRDGSELAAPLTSEVSMYHFPKMSPDGRSLAAVDWSGSRLVKVWGLAGLDEVEQKITLKEDRLMLSELNAGGRDGEIRWEELKGAAWLDQWQKLRSQYPGWHRLPKTNELRD